MKNAVFLILATVFSTSCSSFKLVKTLKQGGIKSKTFHSTIPFNYRLGLIIIPVEIDGSTYRFLLDTGAPNVVSPELASILTTSKGVKHKTSDSQGGKNQLQFITIDKIIIGGVEFEKTGAAVADLSQSNEVACLKIDGIIGANLMRLAKWKLDYSNQLVTIANDLKNLEIDTTFSVINFKPEITGTPKISIQLDGTLIENVKFDTGSAGFLDLPTSSFEKLKATGKSYSWITSFGANGSGLFGPGQEDTMYYALMDEIKIAEITIPNNTVEFVKDHSALLGTQFFKHFNVYFDWQKNEIYLQKVKEIEEKPFRSFGFNLFYEDDKLIVKEVFENSEAQKIGVKIGDQIISIDGEDYSYFSKENWCEFIESKGIQALQEVFLEVKRGDEQFNWKVKNNKMFLNEN